MILSLSVIDSFFETTSLLGKPGRLLKNKYDKFLRDT